MAKAGQLGSHGQLPLARASPIAFVSVAAWLDLCQWQALHNFTLSVPQYTFDK
jgi:hypothetical protein